MNLWIREKKKSISNGIDLGTVCSEINRILNGCDCTICNKVLKFKEKGGLLGGKEISVYASNHNYKETDGAEVIICIYNKKWDGVNKKVTKIDGYNMVKKLKGITGVGGISDRCQMIESKLNEAVQETSLLIFFLDSEIVRRNTGSIKDKLWGEKTTSKNPTNVVNNLKASGQNKKSCSDIPIIYRGKEFINECNI